MKRILSLLLVLALACSLALSASAEGVEDALKAASAMRDALNVIGSMLSIPTRWKTKAVPQIMAVSMRSAFPSIFLFSFIGPLYLPGPFIRRPNPL